MLPAPGGKPKPLIEIYNFPSGPKVIPVGKVRPDVITCREPEGSILTTSPVPGVGNLSCRRKNFRYGRQIQLEQRGHK